MSIRGDEEDDSRHSTRKKSNKQDRNQNIRQLSMTGDNGSDDDPSSDSSSEGSDSNDESTSEEESLAHRSRKKTTKRKKKRKDRSANRGQGYPEYIGNRNIRGDPIDSPKRMANPHTSFSVDKLLIKNHLPVKIQWDGTIDGFQEYKYAIEGFYTQCNASYLFDDRFHKLYEKHGIRKVLGHPRLPKYIKITREQLEDARTHLYGAIQQSTRKSNTIKKYLNKHRDERDGLLVWIDLATSQDNEGNSEVREAKLIKITSQVYTRNYPGGLMRYIDDIHDAYAGLDVLGNEFTSKQKMQTLLNNLQASPGVNEYLVAHCRDTFDTFEQCVRYLRKEAV